jgi:hypothetical protein
MIDLQVLNWYKLVSVPPFLCTQPSLEARVTTQTSSMSDLKELHTGTIMKDRTVGKEKYLMNFNLMLTVYKQTLAPSKTP